MRDNLNRASGAGAGGAARAGASQADRQAAQAVAAAKKAADAQVREAARAAKEVDKHYRQQQASLERVARAQDAIFERGARTQARLRDAALRAESRAQDKASRDASRAAERQAREEDMWRRKMAYRTAYHGTIRYFPGMMGHAGRVGMDVLRGAGVSFDLGSSVGRGVSLDSQAVTLANQERIATGRTRGAKFYSDLARRTAAETSSDSDSAMKLQARFAAKTGNYELLDSLTPQLARLARASGADFDQVGMAAGSVFQQLRGDPEAAAKTIEVMRAVIGQSAEGAVDMPDYAKQLGRVAAGAFKFEGDRGQNVAKLSALTQIAMERGATSAADAARSTGSFVSTLGKGARLKQFDAAGVRIYTDDQLGRDGKVVAGSKRNVMRDPFEIIKDAFRATNGNIPQLGTMFMDVLGRKSVESLGAIYTGAGGGERGITAVQKEFDRYMRATMSKDVEAQNMKDIENSTEAKAKRFQENLDKIVATMAERVIPALEKNAGTFLDVAGKMGDLASWVVENPKKAITAGLMLSIGRAGMESVFREALERMMRGGGGGFPVPGGGFGGGGGGFAGPLAIPGGRAGGITRAGVMSGVSRGLGAGLVGAAGYMGAEWLAGQYGASGSAQQTAGMVAGGTAAGAQFGGPVGALVGLASGMLIDSISGLYTQLKGGNWELFGNNKISRASTPEEYDRMMAEHKGGRIAQVAGGGVGGGRITATVDPTDFSRTMGDQLRSTTLKVVVTNAKDFKLEGQPRVDPNGRAPQ